jgi:hypothetical protein
MVDEEGKVEIERENRLCELSVELFGLGFSLSRRK